MKTRVVKLICIIAAFLILITLKLDSYWTDPTGFTNTGGGGGGKEGGKRGGGVQSHEFLFILTVRRLELKVKVLILV